MVLLPYIDGRTIGKIAERIRILIASSFMMIEAKKLNVTASLGATLAIPGDSVETVVGRADKLMYRSKNSGRNRINLEIPEAVEAGSGNRQ